MICSDFFPNPIGGQGIYTYELACNLARRGYDVSVITTRREGMHNGEFTILPVCSTHLLMFAVEAWVRYRKLVETFDIVHGNDIYHLCFLLFRRAWLAVTTIHNTHLQRYRASTSRDRWVFWVSMWLEKYVCRKSDRVIAVSDTTRSALLEYGVDIARVEVIYNGVDTRKFSPRKGGAFRSTVGLAKTDKVILFVGRLVKRKRPLEVLAAFRRLRAADPGFHLVLIGRGPLGPDLQKYVGEHGLEDSVHMLGFVDNNKLPEIYADADLFVLISSGEGLPLAALEALASGCRLVLTYDASGGSKLLRESRRVLEYDLGAESLETRMLEAFKLKGEMGNVEEMSIDTCVQRVAHLYEGVLNDGL